MYEQISTKKETGINGKPRIKVCSSIDFYVKQLCVWGGGRRTKRIIGAVAIVLAMMLIVHVLKLQIGFTENVTAKKQEVDNILNQECAQNVRKNIQNKFQTMVSVARREATLWLVEKTLESGVVGDFIETGVAGGGMTILMESMLVCTNSDKHHFMADNWEGLPPPKTGTESQFKGGEFKVGYKAFESNMNKAEDLYLNSGWAFDKGSWKNYVLKGWFADTLPNLSVNQQFSFLRLDGDCYDCTYDAIVHLYPRLNCGGYVYIDDFWEFPECRRAVRDYMKKYNQNFQSWAVIEKPSYVPENSKSSFTLKSAVHVFNLTEKEGREIKNTHRIEAAWWKKDC